MARLIINQAGEFIRQVDFDSSKPISIGRHAKNDIVLDNIAISSQHARIEPQGDKFFIVDNGSTNGTIVNDSRIARSLLKDGDLIELGKFSLKFWGSVKTSIALKD